MKRFIIVLLLLVLQYSILSAQLRSDSLLNLFSHSRISTDECIELATIYNEVNPDSGNYFAKIALEMAISTDDNAKIGESYYQIADSYYYRDNLDSTLYYYKKSLDYYLRTKENNEIAGVFNDIGQVLQMQSKLDSSLIYFQAALEYIDKEILPEGYYSILINIANSYTYLGKFALANEMLLRILDEGVEALPPEKKSILLNNIGLNYKRASNYDKSIEFYSKAMRINDSLGLQLSLATDYINLGNSYFQWKKYKEALLCFQKSNSIYIECGGTEKIAAVYGDGSLKLYVI